VGNLVQLRPPSGRVTRADATAACPSGGSPPAASKLAYVETYGCQMNVADTDMVLGLLRRGGYGQTSEPERADLILINTCAVREKAEERVFQRASMLSHRRGRPDVVLGITGCMAEHLKDQIRERAPHVDLVIGPDGYRRLLDHVEAARAAMFAVNARQEWNNAWWIDPVLFGKYPEDGVAVAGKDMPKLKPTDLDEMKQPLDYLGLNIYKADTVRRGADGTPERVPVPPGYPRSGVDWQPVTPGCMYWGPRYFYDRYKVPLSITENGLATRDQVFLDGKVHDPQRIDFMHRYLLELSRAIKDGVPVTGYYAWSLLDNFEWADGYKQRFGLVYVDYQNQKRVPKDSFDWYKKVIASSGRSLIEKSAVPVQQVTP